MTMIIDCYKSKLGTSGIVNTDIWWNQINSDIEAGQLTVHMRYVVENKYDTV